MSNVGSIITRLEVSYTSDGGRTVAASVAQVQKCGFAHVLARARTAEPEQCTPRASSQNTTSTKELLDQLQRLIASLVNRAAGHAMATHGSPTGDGVIPARAIRSSTPRDEHVSSVDCAASPTDDDPRRAGGMQRLQGMLDQLGSYMAAGNVPTKSELDAAWEEASSIYAEATRPGSTDDRGDYLATQRDGILRLGPPAPTTAR